MRYSIRQRTSVRGWSAIGALALSDPPAARALILRELERSRGRVRSAAIPLGGNRRTLERIILQLDLWPQVEACRARWAARRRDPLGITKDTPCIANPI